MIVGKKSKSKKRLALSANQAINLQQQVTTTMQANTSTAMPISSGQVNKRATVEQEEATGPANGYESADNDEENIVIDMCDEDEDETRTDSRNDDLDGLKEQLNNYHNNLDENYNSNQVNYYAKLPAAHSSSNGNAVSNFTSGDLVWFDPNQLGYSIPGKILDIYPDMQLLTVEGYAQPNDLEIGQNDLESYNRTLLAADEELQVYNLSDLFQLSSLKLRQPLTQECGKTDLIQLDELSLESIIWNLKLRYKQDLIYTNCGTKILLSVNPFKQLNSIYDLDQANRYDSFDSNKLRCLHKFGLLETYLDTHTNQSSILLRWLLLNDNAKTSDNHRALSDSSPSDHHEAHIFDLANRALMKLLINGQDQCFVLLGESGSGKTEACKLMVQYFASINKSPSNLMTEQILESIQVLESFGNAKTIHNDNSSRFGNLLEIEFSLKSAFIMNAKLIDLNLLDRSRIVGQVEQERNYHVFYELLSGLSLAEKEKYGLQTAEKYFYLNQGNCIELDTKEDGDDFRSLLASMQVLGFNYEEQDTIFRVLASVLHLGNIYFHRKVLAVRSGNLSSIATNEGGLEGVEVGSDTEIRWISHLLQIQFDSVMRCLTVRTTETHQDKIITPLNIDQALDTRDAIARTLYNCLFKWLIQRINIMISAGAKASHETVSSNSRQPPYGLCRTSESLCEFQPDKLPASARESTLGQVSRHQHGHGSDGHPGVELLAASISILDSFGFENLHENNFEQLCINYCAELLQYHTSRYLLRLEQSEYTKERLKWTPLDTFDPHHTVTIQQQMNPPTSANNGNGASGVINLLSKKPLGILALLDDECNFPKATDQSFVEKCHHNHTLNENYQRARLAPNCNQEFGVRHFRQQTKLVWYQVEGFIEKNRDTLRADILDLLLNSKMSIVVDMLKKLHRGASSLDMDRKTRSRTYDGRYVSMKPRATTVAAKFQDTLQNNKVLESINPRVFAGIVRQTSGPTMEQSAINQQTMINGPGEPWFIVCLKPNRSRTPALFDVAYVQDQVISMNLHDICQIRQNGYPFKMRFDEFVREYLCLVPSRHLNSMSVKKGQVKRGIRDVCKSIVEYASGTEQTANRFTKEFQCGLTKVFLSERLFDELERRRLAVHQEAISLLQRTIRMWLARTDYLEQRDATIVIQAHWRAHLARREFWRQYMLIVALQRRWRLQLALIHRRKLEQQRQARRNQQQFQLQEMMQKSQPMNQFRFRQQNLSNNSTPRPQHLDIPQDLAQLYRMQREWLPVHDLSHLQEISLDDEQSAELDKQDKQLIHKIELDDRFAFQELLSNFYTKDSPQFGYSRLPITRPFDWPQLVKRRKLALNRAKRHSKDLMMRNELISSVKRRFESVRDKSIQVYKLILRYIDSDNSHIEQQSSQIEASQKLIKFKLLADYVIYLCISDPLLRNEIYLQLASLIWQNPRQKSIENCWRLLLNCLSCFAPESTNLTRYLLRYTIDTCCHEECRQSLLKKLANHLLCNQEPRKFPPSILEYRAVSRGIRRLALSASTYDSSCYPPDDNKNQTFRVESHTTAQEFARTMLRSKVEQKSELRIGEQNLFGWTVEVISTGSAEKDNPISCRLRGDDKILDHFSEIELQPEFKVQHDRPLPSNYSDFEAAPLTNMTSRLSGQSSSSGYRHHHNDRYSSDLELSPRSSGLSQTSRLNRRYLMQQANNHPSVAYNCSSTLNYDHYDEPLMMTSKSQFNRRSISMQELQLATVNGARYLSNGSNHYACSPSNYAPTSGPKSVRRTRTPTQGPSFGHHTNRISSSAYGSEPYHRGPQNGIHLQHRGQQSYHSNSLSRDVGSNQRPRRSSSSSSFALARPDVSGGSRLASGGGYQGDHSDYVSACCSDYGSVSGSQNRRIYVGQDPFASRPLPTPSKAGRLISSQSAIGTFNRNQSAGLRSQPTKRSSRRTGGSESHYVASSAMSDTSEAPSLASHVRAVKVPQANGDLDQYLDDLFNPLLDDLDGGDMSDARSLAPSIRMNPSKGSLLENLCDPNKLSKIIRGRDEPTRQNSANRRDNGLSTDEISGPLSPTFESLLTSLRHGDGGVGVGESSDEDHRPDKQVKSMVGPGIGAQQLGEMNLSQLKALNEKLEHEIIHQGSSLSSATLVKSGEGGKIPEPPPQPSFEQLPASALQQSSFYEDLYDRAKTIRIGKVRWPPLEDPLLDVEAKTIEETPPCPKQSATVEQVSRPENETRVEGSRPPMMDGSIGKLKISSEMKAKLEQLTNSGTGNNGCESTSSSPPPATNKPVSIQEDTGKTGSGIVSQAKSSLLASQGDLGGASQVRRLAMQRKHLLESQLLGCPSSRVQSGHLEGGASHRESFSGSGSKVMAAKQQLAAAAGVALALLDSGSANSSQAPSRRQSAALQAAEPSKQVRGDYSLMADELGPQSRSAINQRLAFYQQSTEHLADDQSAQSPSTRPSEVIAEEPPTASEPASSGSGAKTELFIPAPGGVSRENPEKQTADQPQMLSDTNEARSEHSPAAKEANGSEYGQLVAKTLAQRQLDDLRELRKRSGVEESRDWIASSPDHQIDQTGCTSNDNKRSMSQQAVANNHKRARSSSSNYQHKQQPRINALTYSKVSWQLKVRKELFLPSEGYDNPLMLQLIFCQIVADISRPQQVQTRLNNKERAAVRSILKEHSISIPQVRRDDFPGINQLDHMKRDIIKLARSFGLYFTRTYEAQNYALTRAEDRHSHLFDDLWLKRRRSSSASVCSEGLNSDEESCNSDHTDDQLRQVDAGDLGRGHSNELPEKLLDRLGNANNLGLDWIDLVAVHHSGLRLVVAIPSSSSSSPLSSSNNNSNTPTHQQQKFGYKVLETLKYRDMADVSLVGERKLLVSMRNGRKCWLLSSGQATQLSELLKRFHLDYNSQLKKTPATGSSQAAAATSEANRNSKKSAAESQQDFDEDDNEDSLSRTNTEADTKHLGSDETGSVGVVSQQSAASSKLSPGLTASDEKSTRATRNNHQDNQDGKYSLLQFALYNFREAIDKYSLANKSTSACLQQPSDQQNIDTGTLRGSLKLIETLRRSKDTSGSTNSKNATKERLSAPSKLNVAPGESASNGSNDWTWRELAQMVKFTSKPIKFSLLKLPSGDLNRRAVDCFASIMQYMGDLTSAGSHPSSKLNEVECVYMILMNCHNFPILRDEIYCQIMKQTTNNRSEQQDSCLRGWRLFSMIGAYFNCSELLRPYLLKYLETAAYDKRRAYCSVALICLQNLRKTIKYGGRKNVPSIEEIAATSAGRNSKRQIYRLPGGTERVINTKSSTVVEDIIYEICSSMLDIANQDEMLEFSLYCIADGDLYTMPLNRDEYILDVTTELIKNHQQYFLIFCRSIWHYPLRLDSKLYIEVIFNQIAPDYLEGLLLVLADLQQQQRQQQLALKNHRRLSSGSSSSTSTSINRQPEPDNELQQTMAAANNNETPLKQDGSSSSKYQLRLETKLVMDIARIAALLHRASGTDYMPQRDEVKYLLPKPIIAAMKQSHLRANGQHSSAAKQNLLAEVTSETGSQAPKSNEADAFILVTPQKWVELVQENWRELSAFDTLEAKAQFLQLVRHWPLFGSSFFAIKLIQRDLMQPIDYILALNKQGIQMLDRLSHETIHRYSFNEVISTRKVRSEDGALFLDLKCGNLMKRTIIRIQTDQAHEISRLIRQYIDIEMIQQKQQQQQQQHHQEHQESSTGSDSSARHQQENPTISS